MFPDHLDSRATKAPFVRSRIATAALALSLSLAGGTAVAAQDATPTAGGEVVCTAPNVATPEAGASPVASPAAEDLTAAPVVDDQATIDELTAVATECAPDGATELEVLAVYGFADGRYAVDYQYRNGVQVIRMLDVYSNQTGTWTLETQTPESPQTDLDSITTSVKFGAEPGVIELSPAQFAQQPAIKFRAANEGTDAMTFSLYQGSEDFDPASVTGQDATAVEGTLSAPLGSAAVPAGEQLEVLFEGLEPGAYVIVIFDGTGAADSAALVTIDEPLELEVPDVVGGGQATPAASPAG